MSPSDQIGVMRLSSDPGAFTHSGPSYSHFAQNSGHPTGLSQLFGPSAIGIGIPPTTQQNKPPQQRPITQPTAASVGKVYQYKYCPLIHTYSTGTCRHSMVGWGLYFLFGLLQKCAISGLPLI